MRDMHCHILPGVDDGARDLEESFAMLAAARAVGIDEIVCTPHCRDPYFDFDAMWAAFRQLKEAARMAFPDIALHMGFEVNHRRLMELGMEHVDDLAFADSREFLLELGVHSTPFDFSTYKRTIFEIQSRGYRVIISHPERYLAIQKDVELARDLVSMGCYLQASADFVAGGRLGAELKPAKRLLKEGLYTYFASDAHRPEHYAMLAKAYGKYGKYLA
ncbi:MAG: phosphoesterase [Eggerthellaceae bacterium]|nr:phosphoesterase [Eggerthellaceae bacterium]